MEHQSPADPTRQGAVNGAPDTPASICLCGCEQATQPGRRFINGHPARLRGLVARVNRGAAPRSAIPARAWEVLVTCPTCRAIGFTDRDLPCGR